MIYLLKQKEHNRFKIGISEVPSERIATLKKTWGEFDNDSIIAEVKNSFRLEQAFHTVFATNNIQNLEGDGKSEWFDMDCFDNVNALLVEQSSNILDINELEIKTVKTKKVDQELKDNFTLSERFQTFDLEEHDQFFQKPDDFNSWFNRSNVLNMKPNGVFEMRVERDMHLEHLNTNLDTGILINNSIISNDSRSSAVYSFSLNIIEFLNQKQRMALLEDLFDNSINRIDIKKDYRESYNTPVFNKVETYVSPTLLDGKSVPTKLLEGATSTNEVFQRVEAFYNYNGLSDLIFDTSKFNCMVRLEKDMRINGIKVFRFFKKLGFTAIQLGMTKDILDWFDHIEKDDDTVHSSEFITSNFLDEAYLLLFEDFILEGVINCNHYQLMKSILTVQQQKDAIVLIIKYWNNLKLGGNYAFLDLILDICHRFSIGVDTDSLDDIYRDMGIIEYHQHFADQYDWFHEWKYYIRDYWFDKHAKDGYTMEKFIEYNKYSIPEIVTMLEEG